MRIDGLLYFAPGVRFGDIDLCGPDLPHQFQRRIVGFYLDPAVLCAANQQPFAAGVLLVTCIDALAKTKYGRAKKRFSRFLIDYLESFRDDDLAERFFKEFRNGIVHQAQVMEGGQFSLDTGETITNEEVFSSSILGD